MFTIIDLDKLEKKKDELNKKFDLKKEELDKKIEKKKKEKYSNMSAKEKKDAMDKEKRSIYIAVLLFLAILGIFYMGKIFMDALPIAHTEEEVSKPKIYVGYNEDYKEDYVQDGQIRQGTVTDGAFSYSEIPAFNDTAPYYVLNGNKPYFDTTNIQPNSYENYSELDELGRVGVCESVIGTDLMPTEKRGPIGHVKPSGWNQKRYDNIIKDKYLYNRAHLIGFQLTAENDNKQNLMTGTRFFNVDGMLPFENEVADYVKTTNNHVKYRITPVFIDKELVARGIIMEAYSVEDNGRGVCFNVFVYNNQPGIEINYADGSSREAGR